MDQDGTRNFDIIKFFSQTIYANGKISDLLKILNCMDLQLTRLKMEITK